MPAPANLTYDITDPDIWSLGGVKPPSYVKAVLVQENHEPVVRGQQLEPDLRPVGFMLSVKDAQRAMVALNARPPKAEPFRVTKQNIDEVRDKVIAFLRTDGVEALRFKDALDAMS